MRRHFWNGRRVFVTGHTGFKGSWLSLWLQDCGARVSGFALAPPTRPSLFEAAQVGAGMASHEGDVRDAARLARVLREAEPEVVFHLAAQPLVRESYLRAAETFAVNVMGTVNLLDAVREAGTVRCVVNVTTDKCYENREWDWGYRELDALGGADPYSASKACSELATAAWRSSFFAGERAPGVATARAGNVIGGGDYAVDRLVPDVLRAWAGAAPVEVRNPDAVRPWQHVLEPLRGYVELAEALWARPREFSQAWNFGPLDDDAMRVRDVLEALARRWPGTPGWTACPGPHPHEAASLRLDISKARAHLGWRPAWRLVRALEMTLDWERARGTGADARELCLAQIHRYEQDCPDLRDE